jgi:UDP-N-acetylmuramate: L-alanyl-gamma-D-glutamyl-meso-diaminopimelate ligase
LLAHCLEKSSAQDGSPIDPSYFIGAIPLTPSASAHMGNGNIFVIEGDEYPSSNTDNSSKFLHYSPRHLLITPLAHDHFNVFPTPEDYLRPFSDLENLTPQNGTIVACLEGDLSRRFHAGASHNIVSYGVHEGDFKAAHIRWGERTNFSLLRGDETIVEIETSQLGEHNIQNIVGVGAFLLTRNIVSAGEFSAAVSTFRGIKRRLDKKSEKTTIPIYEGFGSSYEKAVSAIAAMRRHFPKRQLLIIFEPHTFSWRNSASLPWYDKVFAGASKVFIYEPASQGASTHEQITQRQIVERVAKAGIEVDPINDTATAIHAIGAFLKSDSAVLLLTSGNLGGLIDQVPLIAEQKFPK